MDLSVSPLITQLCDLLLNPAFPAQLSSVAQSCKSKNLFLRIEASLSSNEQSTAQSEPLYLVCLTHSGFT
ncbi:hypothetical protein BJX64DRAFT_265274 [Aspergillus heterothallicus]